MPGKLIRSGTGTSGTRYQLRFDEGDSGSMSLYVGRGKNAISVGAVCDAENFETAVDEADEKTRRLMADARREFGL